MGNPATYEDANLILRLYEARREEKLRKARDWFGSSFTARTREEALQQCPPGSEQNAYFRMVVGYWEMAASFVAHGILNEDLFFENSGEFLFVWERTRHILADWREMMKNPDIGRNTEVVAKRYIEWMNRRAPEAYSAYQSMMQAAAQTAAKE